VTLVAAIHDVTPRNLARVVRLRDRLGEAGVTVATLLCIPNHHGVERLAASTSARAWLRGRADAGDEICLHGDRHLCDRRIPRWTDRLRARLFCRGEAECLAQDSAARRRMLIEGRAELEDVVGRRVGGFVAPGWLEPRGLDSALAGAGFRWHESRWGLARLDGSSTIFAPVVSFAAAGLVKRPLSVATARVVAGIARRGSGPVRLALHPADDEVPELARAAASILASLLGLRAVTASEALGLA